MRRLPCAPAQVLDDPVRIADGLAAEDGDGDVRLAGQRGDLLAVAPPPRHADLVEVLPLPLQLARDAPARAQPVGRGAAAVESGHQGSNRLTTASVRRAAKPATRS